MKGKERLLLLGCLIAILVASNFEATRSSCSGVKRSSQIPT